MRTVWMPGRLGVVAHAVEQHGLADAAEPDHQDALGREAETHPLERDANGLAKLVAAGELRRRRAGAWGEGVA